MHNRASSSDARQQRILHTEPDRIQRSEAQVEIHGRLTEAYAKTPLSFAKTLNSVIVTML